MHKSIKSTQLLKTLFISYLYVFKKETLLYLGLHFVLYLNISLYLFGSDYRLYRTLAMQIKCMCTNGKLNILSRSLSKNK